MSNNTHSSALASFRATAVDIVPKEREQIDGVPFRGYPVSAAVLDKGTLSVGLVEVNDPEYPGQINTPSQILTKVLTHEAAQLFEIDNLPTATGWAYRKDRSITLRVHLKSKELYSALLIAQNRTNQNTDAAWIPGTTWIPLIVRAPDWMGAWGGMFTMVGVSCSFESIARADKIEEEGFAVDIVMAPVQGKSIYSTGYIVTNVVAQMAAGGKIDVDVTTGAESIFSPRPEERNVTLPLQDSDSAHRGSVTIEAPRACIRAVTLASNGHSTYRSVILNSNLDRSVLKGLAEIEAAARVTEMVHSDDTSDQVIGRILDRVSEIVKAVDAGMQFSQEIKLYCDRNITQKEGLSGTGIRANLTTKTTLVLHYPKGSNRPSPGFSLEYEQHSPSFEVEGTITQSYGYGWK